MGDDCPRAALRDFTSTRRDCIPRTPSTPHAPRRHMATILYVDDEPAIGLILEDTLKRAGHATVGAHSVPEALQALAKGNVDLIISEYRMPRLEGAHVL